MNVRENQLSLRLGPQRTCEHYFFVFYIFVCLFVVRAETRLSELTNYHKHLLVAPICPGDLRLRDGDMLE